MEPARHSLLWARIAALGISGFALYLVFRRLDLDALGETLRTMKPAWFVAGILLYGFLFVPAVARWHLILRAVGADVGPAATFRAYLAGHCFYVLLFGAIGGDAARSACYARWHRFPMARIMATAPLDRLLGALGLILFGLLGVAFQSATGGFHDLKGLAWRAPWWWWSAILLCPAVLYVAWRSRAGSFGRHFFETLRDGLRMLLSRPRLAVAGILYALLVQVALSGALALNLEAVSHTPVPWARVLWAFPVVGLIGALPVTVAGLGAREGAALLLLGLCGISSATAVAASLLTATASLLWAFLGAILWAVEARAYRKRRRAANRLEPSP